MNNVFYLLMFIFIRVAAAEKLNPVEKVLPIESTNSSTMDEFLGIDSDGDGVRDDLERVIFKSNSLKKYPKFRQVIYSYVYRQVATYVHCEKGAMSDKCLQARFNEKKEIPCLGEVAREYGFPNVPADVMKVMGKIIDSISKSERAEKIALKLIESTQVPMFKKYGFPKKDCTGLLRLKEGGL